jgi:hypothetical protein
MYNRDFRIPVHRSRGDSGQNEAERTNSAIGDAVVDGTTELRGQVGSSMRYFGTESSSFDISVI